MPKLTNKCAICGKPILKSWTICDECREKQRRQEEEINIEIAKTRARLIPEVLWENADMKLQRICWLHFYLIVVVMFIQVL